MKSKTLLYLGITAIVLIAVWGLPRLFDKGGSEEAVDFSLSSINEENIDRIRIAQADKKTELERTSGGWQVAEFEVDSEKISIIWDKLSDASITGPVARNQANHAKFKVAETDGLKVIFQKGTEEVEAIIIGKSGSSFGTTYIRQVGDDNVYIINADLSSSFPLEVSYWRNKDIVSVNRDQVDRIDIVTPDYDLTLSKQTDNTWLAEDASRATTTPERIMNSLFSNLAPLQANGFIEGDDLVAFNNEAKDTRVKVLSGSEEVLAELELVKQDDNWWVRLESSETVYEVPQYRISSIILNGEELFEPGND